MAGLIVATRTPQTAAHKTKLILNYRYIERNDFGHLSRRIPLNSSQCRCGHPPKRRKLFWWHFEMPLRRCPVTVQISSQTAHNFVCVCTQCWKPKGSVFSQIAVVGKDHVTVLKNAEKLKSVDPPATIQRHACHRCANVWSNRKYWPSVLGAGFYP